MVVFFHVEVLCLCGSYVIMLHSQSSLLTIRQLRLELFDDFQAAINGATQMIAVEKRAEDE